MNAMCLKFLFIMVLIQKIDANPLTEVKELNDAVKELSSGLGDVLMHAGLQKVLPIAVLKTAFPVGGLLMTIGGKIFPPESPELEALKQLSAQMNRQFLSLNATIIHEFRKLEFYAELISYRNVRFYFIFEYFEMASVPLDNMQAAMESYVDDLDFSKPYAVDRFANKCFAHQPESVLVKFYNSLNSCPPPRPDDAIIIYHTMIYARKLKILDSNTNNVESLIADIFLSLDGSSVDEVKQILSDKRLLNIKAGKMAVIRPMVMSLLSEFKQPNYRCIIETAVLMCNYRTSTMGYLSPFFMQLTGMSNYFVGVCADPIYKDDKERAERYVERAKNRTGDVMDLVTKHFSAYLNESFFGAEKAAVELAVKQFIQNDWYFETNKINLVMLCRDVLDSRENYGLPSYEHTVFALRNVKYDLDYFVVAADRYHRIDLIDLYHIIHLRSLNARDYVRRYDLHQKIKSIASAVENSTREHFRVDKLSDMLKFIDSEQGTNLLSTENVGYTALVVLRHNTLVDNSCDANLIYGAVAASHMSVAPPSERIHVHVPAWGSVRCEDYLYLFIR